MVQWIRASTNILAHIRVPPVFTAWLKSSPGAESGVIFRAALVGYETCAIDRRSDIYPPRVSVDG